MQEAWLTAFICITSTAICQPDTGGGWGSGHNDHFNHWVVSGAPVKKNPGVISSKQSMKVFLRPYVLWDCKALLSCTCRCAWGSHRNIKFTILCHSLIFPPFLLRQHMLQWVQSMNKLSCVSFTLTGLYKNHTAVTFMYSTVSIWIHPGLLWLWEVSVCPCWRMSKGCSKQLSKRMCRCRCD